MANSWLRLYHDMPNDPKFKTIARVSKQPIAVVLGLYVHLLVNASAAVDRGTLDGYNIEDLATALDVEPASIGAILDAMQGRVLDGDKVSGWEKRQVNREDGGAERAKAWREAKKAKTNAANGTRTQPNATERNRTADKSREEEIRKEETKTLASTAVAVTAARGNVLGSLPLTGGRFYKVCGDDLSRDGPLYPGIDVEQEYRDMRGWLLANPRRRKTPNGIRNFMNNWLARAQDKQQPGVGNGTYKGKTGHSVDAAARAIQEIEDREAFGRSGDSQTGEAGRGGLPVVRERLGETRASGLGDGDHGVVIEASR